MALNLVPSGNIGLTDLIQRIVQKLYGLDAVAPAKVYESSGQLVVFRAGTKISYTDEIARWESTQEAICQVFAAGAATALVMNTNGDELTIPQDYWDCGSAWRTMLTGRFEYDSDPTVHRRPVYLRQSECEEILERCLRPDEQTKTGEDRVDGNGTSDEKPPRKRPAKERHNRWLSGAKEKAAQLKKEKKIINISQIAKNLQQADQDAGRTVRDRDTVRRFLSCNKSEWHPAHRPTPQK